MKKYITIYMLENGYLAQEHTDTGGVFRSVFLKDISIDRLLSFSHDHQTAIKAVRTYIRDNHVDMSDGLKDVKDYVESVREWPYPACRV